jgi:hypothetical protein
LLGALVNIWVAGFHHVILACNWNVCTHQYAPEQMDGVCGKEMATNTFHCIPVQKLTTVVTYIYQPSTCIVLIITKWVLVIFLGWFCEKCLEKKQYFVTDSLFWGIGREGGEIAKTKIFKNFHHCQNQIFKKLSPLPPLLTKWMSA